jgi:AcrR family transcriptional regulator
LYYHVGDKEALYAAVLHNALGSTASRIEQAAMVSDLPPGDRLRAYVRSFARAVDDHPQMTPIMMRELASGGRNLPGEVVEDFSRIIAVISAILDEGCRRAFSSPPHRLSFT